MLVSVSINSRKRFGKPYQSARESRLSVMVHDRAPQSHLSTLFTRNLTAQRLQVSVRCHRMRIPPFEIMPLNIIDFFISTNADRIIFIGVQPLSQVH